LASVYSVSHKAEEVSQLYGERFGPEGAVQTKTWSEWKKAVVLAEMEALKRAGPEGVVLLKT